MRLPSAIGLLLVAGCRPEAPALVYPEPSVWDPTAADEDFYGDDPYVDGEQRLDIGVFYEGGSSEQLVVDDTTRHFYIYESTFSMSLSDDRVEGYVADRIEPTGNLWWGGGVHWDQATDLSAWTTLHFAAKSYDAELENVQVGMTGSGTEARVALRDLGFRADGSWQSFDVPLQSFANGGADLTSVTVPLLLLGEGAPSGTGLLLDDLYFVVGEDDEPIDTPEFLGDNPYDDGDERLSLGIFYEGGYSELRELDGDTRHFYIFSNTFTMASSEERVEGLTSDRIETASSAWFGGSVAWDVGEDLSAWDVLHVSVRSSTPTMEAVQFGLTGGGTEVRVPLAELGFQADGEWHTLDLPLSRFVEGGADLTDVTVPLLIVSEGNTEGDELFVDDLYFTVSEG